MSRKGSQYHEDISLPWQVEGALALVSLPTVPLAMIWIVWRITTPISRTAESLGVPLDLESVIEPLQFGILAFGLLMSFKVWLWLRERVVRVIAEIPI